MQLLENLILEEVSLVDRPANESAKVTFFKFDKEENTMSDTVEKMSDDMKRRMKMYMDKGYSKEEAMKMCERDMKKADDYEDLVGKLDELGFVVDGTKVTKKAEPEYIEVNGEKVVKSDIPAPVLKALEAAENERVEKQAKETLPNFDTKVAVKLLKAADADEKILEALKAADKAFELAMKEQGDIGSDLDMTDPNEKLSKMASEYATKHGVTVAKAYDAVLSTKEGKDLYKKMYSKEDN